MAVAVAVGGTAVLVSVGAGIGVAVGSVVGVFGKACVAVGTAVLVGSDVGVFGTAVGDAGVLLTQATSVINSSAIINCRKREGISFSILDWIMALFPKLTTPR